MKFNVYQQIKTFFLLKTRSVFIKITCSQIYPRHTMSIHVDGIGKLLLR